MMAIGKEVTSAMVLYESYILLLSVLSHIAQAFLGCAVYKSCASITHLSMCLLRLSYGVRAALSSIHSIAHKS